jgi:hypothetical protein
MSKALTTFLYTLYSAMFPHFFTEEAELRPEPDRNSLRVRIHDKSQQFLDKHPTLARIRAHICLNYYLPVFRPIFWWRHTFAVNQLLEATGWIDIDPDL